MERNPVQFHMNPTVPKKANKQGTLFSAQKKYSRGYTPERMREVTANLNSVHTPSPLVGETHPFAGKEGAAKVRETLARSTMPARAMKGANVVIRSRSEVPANQPKTVGGVYRPNAARDPKTKKRTGGNVSLYANTDHSAKYGAPDEASKTHARRSAEVTLLHEMGHHRSAMADTPQSNYHTEQDRGLEEGYADHHARQAWVPDKRDKKAQEPAMTLSHNSYAPGLSKKDPEFAAGYAHMRNKMAGTGESEVKNPVQFKQGTLF